MFHSPPAIAHKTIPTSAHPNEPICAAIARLMIANMVYDAIIIGGSAAGLSAAVVLGRCRRSVLVLDAGHPRNYASRHVHNFLTRDGIHPAKLLSIARHDIRRYAVQFRKTFVTSVACTPGGFAVRTRERLHFECRLLLLATGVVDLLPTIPDLPAFYGKGVHHCPYCDAYEYANLPMAAYGCGKAGLGLALNLLTWSKDVTILADGEHLDASSRRQAHAFGLQVREERIIGLRSARDRKRPTARDPLTSVLFDQGPPQRVSSLFFNTGQVQRSGIPARLGCAINADGGIVRDKRQRTGVPGLFLAGDASADVQFIVVAAAEGAKAGVAMNRELQDRERGEVLKR